MALFIAVGYQGARWTSSDGAVWKLSALGKEGEVYRAAAYGKGRSVAIGTFGGSNIYAVSSDGQAWETGTKEGQYKFFMRGLGFGGDLFVGIGGDPGSVGSSAPFVVHSKDGLKWSDYTPISGKHILRRITYGNGLWVGVGDRGRRSSSKDGLLWTDPADTKPQDTLIDVGFGNGVFVGVGLHGLRMLSEDGQKWTDRWSGEEGEHLNSILWAHDRFVAVGLGATYISPDGRTWKREPNRNAPLAVAFGGGVFVGTNWKGRLLRSIDGIEWTQVHKADQQLDAIVYAG